MVPGLVRLGKKNTLLNYDILTNVYCLVMLMLHQGEKRKIEFIDEETHSRNFIVIELL